MAEQVEVLLRGRQYKKLLEKNIISLRKRYSLTRAEIEVLYYLSICGEKNTSKDIWGHLKMNKGHISQTVDMLAHKGYIVTSPDLDDHRYLHCRLKNKSESIVTAITNIRNGLYASIFEGLSEEETALFSRLAEKINENMKNVLESEE